MSRLKHLFLSLLLFCLGGMKALNQQQADSLKKIAETGSPNEKLQALKELSQYYKNKDNDACFASAVKALKLAEELQQEQDIWDSKLLYVAACIELRKFDEAKNLLDELEKLVLSEKNIQREAGVLFNFGSLNERMGNYQKALTYHQRTLQLRKKYLVEIKNEAPVLKLNSAIFSIATSELNIADTYEKLDLAQEAIKYYRSSIKLFYLINEVFPQAQAYNNLSLVYINIGQYNNALESALQALRMKEITKDEVGMGNTYHNIGNIQMGLNNFTEAEKYYSKALEFRKNFNDKEHLGMNYGNLGVVYENLGNFEKAIENFKLAIENAAKVNDSSSIASCYINLGNLHIKQGDLLIKEGQTTEAQLKFKEALSNFLDANLIFEKTNDTQNLGILNINLGVAYVRIKNYAKGKECYQKAIRLNKEDGNLQGLFYSIGNLHELDTILGDYKEGYRNFKKHMALRDSLMSIETSKKNVQMQMQYEFDKKETEGRLAQEKKDEITKKEITHQKQQRNFLIAGFLLVAALAIFILKGYRQKQKANILLEEKNVLIDSQKKLVEHKNKEITDSINYARFIQQAILSPKEKLSKVYPDSFILYKPKDIVSGDFYWILHLDEKEKNKNILVFAAADCTGHGVPGAFMSMLNSTLLNQTAYNPAITSPSDALNFLNRELPKNLHTSNESQAIKDGMDIGFCLIDLNTNKLKFSGANNPCWIIRGKELIELDPTKQAITASEEYSKKTFSDVEFQLQKNDCIYVFTDGYADQFGGPKGKKFKYKTLSDLLIELNAEKMKKQSKILEQRFLDWKGELEQVDDVCIIGIRV